MNLLNTFNIHRYHKEKIKQFGIGTSGAIGWKTIEGQLVRFEILSQIADLNNSSVLDAGCGYGDLCGFLNKKFTEIRYFGVDLDELFLDFAIQKYGNTGETAFFLGDFTKARLPVTDYIFASGAFNYYNSDPEFVFKAITKLFGSCRFGFGFNLLSKVDSTGSVLVAYDPDAIKNFCQSLTSKIILKEGYCDNDFTLMLYHQKYYNVA